jgi:osmotically-inducible protein OsmY
MGGTNDWQWKSDSELEQAVECQLSKRPFARHAEINVSVDDGTAILRGTVKDHDSVRSAVVDAYQAGVRDVVSKLEVIEE